MKSLINFIIENTAQVNEGIETITDENTGETMEIWRPDDEPEQAVETIKKTAKAKKDKRQQYLEIRDKLWDLEDEKIAAQEEINSLRSNYKETMRDMDEEVGNLYSDGKDAEAEKLANKYGKELDKMEKQREKLVKKVETLENKIWKLRKQRDKILDDA